MKVAVVGAGAMGSLYGGIFAEDGHEVYFIDVYKPLVDAVNEHGLVIQKEGKERTIKGIKATDNASEVGVVDLIILFVKSTATEMAIKGNSSLIGEDTVILTLQNGLGNIEKIEQYADRKQIIAGTSANGANVLEPGKINHAGWGGTTIGELDGSETERIKTIRDMLNTGELGPATISDNIIGMIWDKLLVNVGINALGALTRMRNGELLEFPEVEALFEDLVKEGVAVAKACGIRLGFEDSVEHAKDVARSTSSNICSMLADVLNSRKTEIDTINGAIVRLGKEYDVPTPKNELISVLIKGLQNYRLEN